MNDRSAIRFGATGSLLVGLFAIAIVPLLGAFWLYESSRSSKPWGTTNRGELLDPIVLGRRSASDRR